MATKCNAKTIKTILENLEQVFKTIEIQKYVNKDNHVITQVDQMYRHAMIIV